MHRANIVVVESDASVRHLFDEVLHDEGYSVELLEPGRLSAGRLAAAAPDLLLLEVTPTNRAQVLALVAQLRRRPDTARLPVLVSTTDKGLLAPRAADLKRLGCDVLLKPFGLDGLLEAVCTSLGAPQRSCAA